MKIAISIPDEIFQEIEGFSKEHRYSRSEVFVMAVKEFLEKLKSKELFNALKEVYSRPESLEKTTLRGKSKRYYPKKILGLGIMKDIGGPVETQEGRDFLKGLKLTQLHSL